MLGQITTLPAFKKTSGLEEKNNRLILENSAGKKLYRGDIVTRKSDNTISNDFFNPDASPVMEIVEPTADGKSHVIGMPDGRMVFIKDNKFSIFKDGAWGAPQTFDMGSSRDAVNACLVSENKILVAWHDITDGEVRCAVAQIDDITLELGALCNVYTQANAVAPKITALTPNKAIMVYKDPADNKGRARVINIAGILSSAESATAFNANAAIESVSVNRVSDISAVVCYEDAGSNKANAESLRADGDDIICSSRLQISETGENVTDLEYKTLAENYGILAYIDSQANSTGISALIGISGTQLSKLDSFDFCLSNENMGAKLSLVRLAKDLACVTYGTATTGTFSRILDIGAKKIAGHPPVKITDGTNDIFIQGTSAGWERSAVILGGPSPKLYLTWYAGDVAGIIEHDADINDDVSICIGGIKDGFSGLGPGIEYYVNSRFGNVISTNGFAVLGEAITKTQMNLKGKDFQLASIVRGSSTIPGKRVMIFKTSGIFPVPVGVEVVDVFLVGGGGSGSASLYGSDGIANAGSFNTGYFFLAGGGGGGEIIFGKVIVKGLIAVPVTVGEGGDGVPFGTQSGNHGGRSSFGSFLFANPGSGARYSYSVTYGGYGGGRAVGRATGVLSTNQYPVGQVFDLGLVAGYAGSRGGNAICRTVNGDGVYTHNTAGAPGSSSIFASGGRIAGGGANLNAMGGGGASYGPGTDGSMDVSDAALPNSGAGTGGGANGSGKAGSGYCVVIY